MKIKYLLLLAFITCSFLSCDSSSSDNGNNGGEGDTVINLASISGVTPPAYGETPVTTISETEQYTGAVTWAPSDTTFAETTFYTATITLTAKSGYTLTGVAADYFTVAGATSTKNSADSGVVTATFPTTAKVINIASISGVTAPVLQEIPVKTITETEQYMGTVSWDGGWAWSKRFGADPTPIIDHFQV